MFGIRPETIKLRLELKRVAIKRHISYVTKDR